MAGLLNATLVGSKELIGRLASMPAAVSEELLKAVTIYSLKLQAHVVRDKLSGQVLGVRSGDLRRSITQRVEQSAEAVYGYVFSSGDVKYAAFWEFGFKGTEQVREHQRTMLFGKTVQPFTVPAFTRKVDQAARPYLRPALADMREEIRQGMIDAVKLGLRKQVTSG